MTPKKRIFLNIVATYGRSLYALGLGLFTARWALLALGKTDYGLIGLIGGMTAFVSFLNSILAAAVGRFYAVKVGEAKLMGNHDAGIDECRQWFNTALSIHSVIPAVLVAAGYPIGVWMVRHFLDIPADRVTDCVWVWRFTCITCFVAMSNVPFHAMYTAKQEIAELTVYSFVTTTFNALFLYHMITHPGFWLVKYAGWQCLIAVSPQLIIAIRAMLKYEECRFVRAYLWNCDRYRQLLKFVAAQFWAKFSTLIARQGQAILVNKYMGAAYNASATLGNAVASHAVTLSAALDGAFWPAITNKTGECDHEGVRNLCFMSMRISTILVMMFAVPLVLEIREVLRLWLVTPPDFTAEICVVVLIRAIADRMTLAYATAIYGYGKGVVRYCGYIGWSGISLVLISWFFFSLGFGMWSVIIGLSLAKLLVTSVRLYWGRILLGFGFWYWVRTVLLPVSLLLAIMLTGGVCVQVLMRESFLRVVVTTGVCEALLIPGCWLIVLNNAEKTFILRKLRGIVGANKRHK